jgi:photosystem II stability/assembly factor-like uncharacterized protein
MFAAISLPLALLTLTAIPLQEDCGKGPIGTAATDEVHYRFGGEVREIETIFDNGTTYAWIAEDGGRIRHTDDSGASFRFQDTPLDASQTLLDIKFTDRFNGYACGRGGRLLKTSNGGKTWNHYDADNPVIQDDTDSPATNWAVRWVDEDLGFLAGVWSLARKGPDTRTFEQTKLWSSETAVDVQATSGTYHPRFFEFYDVKIIRDTVTSGRWTGVAVGDLNNPAFDPAGYFFYTDSANPKSDGGRNWWLVHRTAFTTGNDVLLNPWEVEFEAEDGDANNMRGYLVGGNTTARGYFYSTPDGGQSWNEEFTTTTPNDPPDHPGLPAELYAVAAMPSGEAMAVGYAGNVWRRNPVTEMWEWRPVPVTPDSNYNPFDRIRVPITCVDHSGGSRAILGGAFGVLRGTADAGQSYIHWNPMHDAQNPEAIWRMEGLHFWNESEGIAIGQFQLIALTHDGGTSWTRVQGGPCSPTSNCNSLSLASIDFESRMNGVVVNPSTGTASSPAPLTQYTNDGGLTWNQGRVPALDQIRLTEVVAAEHGWYWAIGTHRVGSSNLHAPLVLLSRDGGATWKDIGAPTTSSSVRLNGATFLEPNKGLFVGDDAGVPIAWRMEMTRSDITWTPVSPPQPVFPSDSPLRDVASVGTDFATAKVYAVGARGQAYIYDHAQTQFVEFTPITVGENLAVNIISVALSPSGNRVLFGTEPWVGVLPVGGVPHTDLLFLDATQIGFMLRWNEVDQMLDRVKVGHNEATKTLQLISESCGFLLARSHGSIVSGEIGTVGDYTVLRYEEN